MDTSVTNVVAEFDEDVFVPVERLSAGLVVDSDLFADNQKLISKGTVLSQSIISNLTSRGIEQLKVQGLQPGTARHHARERRGPLRRAAG